jgi:hypothetical protein
LSLGGGNYVQTKVPSARSVALGGEEAKTKKLCALSFPEQERRYTSRPDGDRKLGARQTARDEFRGTHAVAQGKSYPNCWEVSRSSAFPRSPSSRSLGLGSSSTASSPLGFPCPSGPGGPWICSLALRPADRGAPRVTLRLSQDSAGLQNPARMVEFLALGAGFRGRLRTANSLVLDRSLRAGGRRTCSWAQSSHAPPCPTFSCVKWATPFQYFLLQQIYTKRLLCATWAMPSLGSQSKGEGYSGWSAVGVSSKIEDAAGLAPPPKKKPQPFKCEFQISTE